MSELEEAFAGLWRILGGQELEREHRFAPPRRFRFDFAHLATKVAIEVEGGVWSKGRHVRPKGFENDAEKYKLAAANGWVVFRVTGRMLKHDPVSALTPIKETIAERLTSTSNPPGDITHPAVGREAATTERDSDDDPPPLH